jgi:origin recognition complex subunit 3
VERADESSKVVDESLFVPLLGGAESPACVRLREKVFEKSWAAVEDRVQAILRNANTATLDEVTSFVRDPNTPS